MDHIKAKNLVNWLVAREQLVLITESPRMRWIIKLENFSEGPFQRECAKRDFLSVVWKVVQHDGFKDGVQGSSIRATYNATWEMVLKEGRNIDRQFAKSNFQTQRETFSEAWKKLEELKLIKYEIILLSADGNGLFWNHKS
eukprot:TRINITY_DN6510_c0_g1_i1.p1 TRINITY_DN6510_c0_g1~~TRINITY_DN6510_c0_g1_i1.p1  ORF type:complete len:141 (+),score=11.96 TRINITY_DN6510_c0_g1_i1:193-615(+)